MYVDTSALLKLLVDEAESEALTDFLDSLEGALVTSEFTIAELHRNAGKHAVDAVTTDELLDQLDLVPVTTDVLRRTGRAPAPPGTFLRTADALHLMTASMVAESDFCTYDARQAAAATQLGFRVVAPRPLPA